jgi:hypothetical protein
MRWAGTCDHRESENGGYCDSVRVKGKGVRELEGEVGWGIM